MGLSSPHVLSIAFFLALAARPRNANAVPSCQTVVPLCRKLRMLHLHYKRWLRGPERNGLIPAFGAIVASHPPEEEKFSFRLGFGKGPESQEWIIHEPSKRCRFPRGPESTVVGVSSPDGVVSLSRMVYCDSFEPLTELEYIVAPSLVLPIDSLLSFHNLKEVIVVKLSLKMEPDTIFT